MKSRFALVVLVIAVIVFGTLPVGLFAGQANCSVTTHSHSHVRHVHRKNGSIHHHQRQHSHQRHQHKQSNQ